MSEMTNAVESNNNDLLDLPVAVTGDSPSDVVSVDIPFLAPPSPAVPGMQAYIGTKVISAIPMTRGDYNKYRGWILPGDEDPTDKGYLVQYPDGYISWSPEEQFLNAYRKTDGLNVGLAVEAMKVGFKVARRNWNGHGMFVYRVAGSIFQVNRKPLLGFYKEGTEVTYNAHYDMRCADGHIVPWICSQTDMDADDWFIVD